MKTLNLPTELPIFKEMIEELDLPEHIEEKVNKRYESLSSWFNRENSTLKDVDIDIFAQGSFALGTTIKPINENEEYDLDMGCKLNISNFKALYSQEKLIELVKNEIEAYRKANSIQNDVEEKRRCLRLVYKDEVAFHLDIVPCIPLNQENETEYRNVLLENFSDRSLALDVAKYAVNISDNERYNFEDISEDWHISNPQGYLRWFQERMNQQLSIVLEQRATVEPIPFYNEKSVLQRCIQLLKRHRDNMFFHPDQPHKAEGKPISIILTTLAAQAYSGEATVEEAILNILDNMPRLINTQSPRIPNPVKPEEDFSDKWTDPQYASLNLEMNFNAWLIQAKRDFSDLIKSDNFGQVKTILTEGFNIAVEEAKLKQHYKYQSTVPKPIVISTPTAKPWCK